jgi:class 3 adenylate cyclase/TolB-like protein
MQLESAVRKLAAIVVADIVGFSRHVERDDAGTLRRLREIREQLIDPEIAKRSGHLVKTTGDGMLLEFGSADAALRFALDVQRAMASRNSTRDKDDRIEFRIGINLGDIILDGDDIAGDGVNVAARLEALARPGGICISAAVREQIHGNVDARFDDIGEQRVKNITRPIRAYAVVPPGSVPGVDGTTGDRIAARYGWRDPRRIAWATGTAAALVLVVYLAQWWASHSARSIEPPPMSVAVLPFTTMQGNVSDAERADAIAHEVTAMLVRSNTMIEVLPVAPVQAKEANADKGSSVRSSNVRYLVEGHVGRDRRETLVSLSLVEASAKELVWSETGSFPDEGKPEDRLRALHALVWHLRGALISAEVRRIIAHRPGEPTPREDVLLAMALDRTEADPVKRAGDKEKLFEEALRKDPNLVPALVGLAGVWAQRLEDGIRVDRNLMVKRMDELTGKAVRLNDTQPTTWFFRAWTLMYSGHWDAALEASAKSMRLEPESSDLMASHAQLTLLAGRPTEALALAEQSKQMDPRGGSVRLYTACEAHLLLGEYVPAIATCEKAKGLNREDWMIDVFLVAAYAQAGDTQKAQQAKGEVLGRAPGLTIAALKARRLSANPDYVRLTEKNLYSGLQKAGFPEN